MGEVNFFIIWNSAYTVKDKIIEDIEKEFNILKIYEINWSKTIFSRNLSRLYRHYIPSGSYKTIECGTGPFLLIIVEDNAPNYGFKISNEGGKQYQNTHIFDCKKKYRKWAGGGIKIHANSSPEEANCNLSLLIGKNTKDFQQDLLENPWNKNIISIKSDLLGNRSWNNMEEMLYIINNSIEYVIIRNHENLFDSIYIEGHEDIDILCSDINEMVLLLNAHPRAVEHDTYAVYINDQPVHIDIRHVDDRYFDYRWSASMLKNRIYDEKGFYKLNSRDYAYSLLYHALIQKPAFSKDYVKRLSDLSSDFSINETEKSYAEKLESFMMDNCYQYTIPKVANAFFSKEKLNYKECENHMKILIFGAGLSSKLFRRYLNFENVSIAAFVDNDKGKSEMIICGKKVILPQDIKNYDYDYIIIATLYYDEVKEQLMQLGVPEHCIIKGLINDTIYRKEFSQIYAVANNEFAIKFNEYIKNSIKYDILVTGSGDVECGIDTMEFNDKLGILTADGQDIYHSYKIINHLYQYFPEQLNNISTCIIGLNYDSFQYRLEKSEKSYLIFNYYNVMKESLPLNDECLLSLYNNVMEYIQSDQYKSIENIYQAPLGYSNDIPIHPREIFTDSFAESMNIISLEKYLQILNKLNIKPIILVMPVSTRITSKYSNGKVNSFYKLLNKVISCYNIEVIDYFYNDFLKDDKHFLDDTHLNKEGAIMMSKHLKSILIKE